MSCKRIWSIGVGGVAILTVLFSAIQEASPINGRWDVARAVENGQELGENELAFGLEIDGNQAKFLCYTICGYCGHSGHDSLTMVRKGNRIDLYARVRMTPELEKLPSDHLTVLPNGRLGYETPGLNGTVYIEFRRTSNASTILDILNWH